MSDFNYHHDPWTIGFSYITIFRTTLRYNSFPFPGPRRRMWGYRRSCPGASSRRVGGSQGLWVCFLSGGYVLWLFQSRIVPVKLVEIVATKKIVIRFIGKLVRPFTGEDLLLAQITSQKVRDEYAIALENDDFNAGSLNKPSNIRPNKLFTCSRNIILYRVGSLKTKNRIRPGRYFFYY